MLGNCVVELRDTESRAVTDEALQCVARSPKDHFGCELALHRRTIFEMLALRNTGPILDRWVYVSMISHNVGLAMYETLSESLLCLIRSKHAIHLSRPRSHATP
jgi:hypothetical protein